MNSKSKKKLMRINAGIQDLALITRLSWSALVHQNQPPELFRSGRSLSRIEPDDDGVPLLRRLTLYRLRHELARRAEFYQVDRNGQPTPAKPPLDVVRDLLATPDPPLPVLTRMVEVPVFTSDGTLHTEPGYCQGSRMYYAPPNGFKLLEVPQTPTPEDLSRAKELIFEELLADFPFADESSKAHALALILLPAARELIEGPTPNHLVESPSPGSGKDLLVDCCLRPSLGPHLAILAQAKAEGEWRRRLTASFKQAAGAILIGNVTRPLDSGVLAAALTAPVWTDRILGRSEMARFPVRCIWTTTANNPRLSTEIARRSIRIRIDPKCPRPWERKDFKHPKLRLWVDQHRPQLVWASLTLIQSWVAAGKPLWEEQVLGSYEDWSAVMGGILAVNEVEGFLSNLEGFHEYHDPEWAAFVQQWWETFGDKKVGVGELFDIAVDSGIELAGETDHARKVSLGKKLTERRDQVIGDYRIQRAGEAQRAALWKLVSGS